MKGKLLTFGIIVSTMILFSCSKDDDSNSTTNYLKVNGKTYELSSGLLDYFGQWYILEGDESYVYDINLFSPNLTFEEVEDENGRYLDIEGNGTWINFDIKTIVKNEITGDYYIGNYDAIYVINHDFSIIGNGDDEFESVWIGSDSGGNLTVEKDGSDYIITFNFKDKKDNSISGYYKGSLYNNDATDYYP